MQTCSSKIALHEHYIASKDIGDNEVCEFSSSHQKYQRANPAKWFVTTGIGNLMLKERNNFDDIIIVSCYRMLSEATLVFLKFLG